jgi:hypothetical protein
MAGVWAMVTTRKGAGAAKRVETRFAVENTSNGAAKSSTSTSSKRKIPTVYMGLILQVRWEEERAVTRPQRG